LLFCAAAFVIFLCLPAVQAQERRVQARLALTSTTPAKIRVELILPGETESLSFRNYYGSVVGLGQRIENVQAGTDQQRSLVTKLAPGEFRIAEKQTNFSYDVDLATPERLEDMSHVSWLGAERGMLMLSDLLPRLSGPGNPESIRIAVELPAGWKVSSNLEREKNGEFVTGLPEKAVFLIGSDLQDDGRDAGGSKFNLTTAGRWPVSKSDIVKTAGRILEEYSRLTTFRLTTNSKLMLVAFPGEIGPERWSAETRGNTVVLMLGNRAGSRQLLSRIGILLSHELFHLWVPNSLALSGDYDWFFEGFTIYQALLTDMRLGLISFEDYLTTIGRVYQSFLRAPDRNRLSLIDASASRWTTSPSLVYDKGFLVAFMFDLIARTSSDCQTSVSSVYADIFGLKTTGHEEGNETIIRLLKDRPGMTTLISDHVEGHGEFDFPNLVAKYGLSVAPNGSEMRVRVRSDLTESQRKVLKCFGYR
jgi:predicted metalloprotease with PDZ domain